MNRPFANKEVLQSMLNDRAGGWSLASLMQKYNVKSHRSIVYLCQKHRVYPPSKPLVLFHIMPVELSSSIRSMVRTFPTERQFTPQLQKKRQETVDKVDWWIVEQFVKDGNHRGKLAYSFTL